MCIPVIGKNVKASISHVEHIVTKSIPFKNTMYTQKTIIEWKVCCRQIRKVFPVKKLVRGGITRPALFYFLFFIGLICTMFVC